MDWRGKLAIGVALVAVAVVFSVASFTDAQVLRPQGEQLGAFAQFKLPDGMPMDQGPAIVEATYRDVGADNSTGNDTLYVVFDRELSGGSVAGADFRLHPSPGGIAGTLTASINSVYSNVVNLTGFTAEPTATDSICIAAAGAIDATGGGTSNEDVSLIRITTGPVIARAVMTAGYGTPNDVSDDEVTVGWTHPVTGVNTANAKADFVMTELGSGALTPDVTFTPGDMSAIITWLDGATTSPVLNNGLGRIKPGVSRIGMIAGAVAGPDGGSDPSVSVRYQPIWRGFGADATTYDGPQIINVGYFDAETGGLDDDVMTIVFNRDIMIGTATAGDFVTSGTLGTPVLGSDDGDHVLTLTAFTGSSLVLGTDTVNLSGGAGLTDYQGNVGQPGPAVVIHPSPIITLARYNQSGSADPATDILEVFFDINVTGSTGDTTNFDYFGFDGSALQVTDNTDNDNILSLVGFSLANAWAEGDRIRIRAGSGLRGFGPISGPLGPPSDGYAGRDQQRVRDGSAPFNLLYSFNTFYTRDTANPTPADTAFVAFNEGGVDDSGYSAFYTRQNFPVDLTYVTAHFNNAKFVANPNPGDTSTDVNLITTFDITPGVGTYSDGTPIDTTDVVRFGLIAADLEGNLALTTPSNLFFGGLVAGPVPCPVDFLALIDDNMIHVSSNGTDRFVAGDAQSALGADSVVAYGEPGFPAGPRLGAAAVAGNGSFGPMNIGPYDGDTIYLISVDDFGSTCGPPGTAIINDLYPPMVAFAFDPLQPFNDRCYSGGDTLRVLAGLVDPTDGGSGLNDLLLVHADLTEFVTTAGADSAGTIFTSLGANQVDDDNDWLDTAANPTFDGNGIMDFPEPFIDENGNGSWDPGEEFVDIPRTGYTANLYDAGDANLDSNDADEHGVYYLEYALVASDLVADPTGFTNFAVLEDLPVILHIKDNATGSSPEMAAISESGAFSNIADGSPELFAADTEAFIATEDSQAPTVSEISYLERQGSWDEASDNPLGNIIMMGDMVHKLAAGEASPYFNLADSTLSDDDVILVALQIDPTPDSADDADFEYLDFDPAGSPLEANGVPGIEEFDDENDGFMDFEDPQVIDAMQADAFADANDSENAPNGVHRLNDRRDNDGDAFFRINPISGGYVWFNIDESDTNGVDDNGDGVVDDSGEVENYTAAADDDEDGIADGSAVPLTVSAGQYLPDPGFSGTIWVTGFTDPATVAAYNSSPSDPTGLDSYADDLTANDGVPGPRDKSSNVTRGADLFATTSFARGAPNVISAQVAPTAGAGGVPYPPLSKDATAFAFDYEAQNGRNLNMFVIAALYGLDDAFEYRMRAVAFDECYQGNENWAVPFRFMIDSEAPVAEIPGPPDEDADPTRDGIQLCDVTDSDVNPVDGQWDVKEYTIEADITEGEANDVAEVDFQIWNPGSEMWDSIGMDSSFPFSVQWSYPGAPINNDPPDMSDTLYFRAIASDFFGNVEAQATCDSLYEDDGVTPCFELVVEIIDCTPPMSCICQIGADYDPTDGAFVPVESAVDISAWFTDGDGDPSTNDVTRVEFQYRAVGSNTWLSLPSLTGVPVDTTGDNIPDVLVDPTGINHPVIATGPDTLKATVTWDTRGLATGTYDLRAIAFDIEGNNNATMACVYSATLDDIALRAYIQPCVNTLGSNLDSLFANVYIHDVAVKQVEFQYYDDVTGQWITIDIQGNEDGERRGDIVLRAGDTPVNYLKDACYEPLLGSQYKFVDVDGDGYNPVDPVIWDINGNGVKDGNEPVIFATGHPVGNGDDLSEFAEDEYYADVGCNGVLEFADWIMQDNPLNADSRNQAGGLTGLASDGEVDVWCAVWDVTGLNGCFTIRAVAMDVFGNVDDDEDGDGEADNDDVIWTEECCVDSDAPVACITSYIPADGGDPVAIPTDATCPLVSPQDSLTFIAEVEGEDVDYVVFAYSLDQGFTWDTFAVDNVGDEWTGVFHYGEFTFPSDTQVNFRARAVDSEGNFDVNPDGCKACLVLAENTGPETDIVLITTTDCDTLDTNTVLRGNASPYCIEPTVLSMHVTAEDNQTIEMVEIWYRKVAGVNPSDTTAWAMVPGMVDDSYPYMFGDPNCEDENVEAGAGPGWDISTLTDGVYEFFPRGYDTNGNETPVFGNPFRFSLSSRTAMVVAVEKNGVEHTSLTPGEEVVIKAELDDMSDTEGVWVGFYFAERVHGEMLDPSGITATTNRTIWHSGSTGNHGAETVWVNGVEATWHAIEDFLALADPGNGDYTITGPNTLTFGGTFADDDTVTIDYQVTDCEEITLGDNEPPYSVAWDADGGGLVPIPTYSDVTHYDIIASAGRNFGPFEGCIEPCETEGFILPLNDVDAPEFIVWGLDYRNPNAPCNSLCPTCGGHDGSIDQDFGSCKSKLSGIEHQFFVTTDEPAEEIASVEMSVGGNAPLSYTLYTAVDDTSVTIPITLNVLDFWRSRFDETDGPGFEPPGGPWQPNRQAIHPDSIENVTITIEGIEAYNVEMTNLGDGWYRYDAVLPLGGEYSYYFDIDYVGDDVLSEEPDPRCNEQGRSAINLPEEVWIYSTEDPSVEFGSNQLNEVRVTVTDNAGNFSNNLMSGGGQGGALGQIWVVYDNVPPVITDLFIDPALTAPGGTVNFVAWVQDDELTADIVGNVTRVHWQVSVDDTQTRWRQIGNDQDPATISGDDLYDGGWSHLRNLPDWLDPANDGIDNDRDGLTDESDEYVYTYTVRVVAEDDCYNTGISCGDLATQTVLVCGELTIDSSIPQACLTSPGVGDIFPVDGSIDLVATSSDDDVDYVVFEYSLDGGASWNTIDATPLNDEDDPWVSNDGSGTYTATWNTSFFARELAGDFYVSLRSRAVDVAGNDQGDDSDLDCNINIILNDTTGPWAAIMQFDADCFDDAKLIQDPTLVLSGDVYIEGPATGWNGLDLATVIVEHSTDGTNWAILGVVNEFSLGDDEIAMWSLHWDTDEEAEGTHFLRAFATDADGNVTNDTDNDGVSDNLTVIEVAVDHTAPNAMLVRVGPEGVNGTTLDAGDLIRADLLEDEVSICPDLPGTITFQAIGEDDGNEIAISSIELQFLDDVTDPENPTWQTISGEFPEMQSLQSTAGYPGVGEFEYRDFPGDDLNPDGRWILEVPSLDVLAEAMEYAVDEDLPAKEYFFRVWVQDYACNVNSDDPGISLFLDHVDPDVGPIYAGDVETEGGVSPVHVAGGDNVDLAVVVDDRSWMSTEDNGGPGDHAIQNETSDIFAVQFSVRADNQQDWTIIGLGTFNDGGTPDDYKDDRYELTWETPMNMADATDSTFSVRATVRDNAGNCEIYTEDDLIEVQDITPPENTLVVGVVGDDCGTYPRTMVMIGEDGYGDGIDINVLSQDLTGSTALGVVARDVTLYAATQAGDASMPGGSVFFQARRAGGDWITIGLAECVARCDNGLINPIVEGIGATAAIPQGSVWSVSWNTLELDPSGDYVWFDPTEDGTPVEIRVYAMDSHFNVEVDQDDAIYQFIVDNTAPTVDVTVVDPISLDEVGTAERNAPNGVVIVAEGGGTNLVNDDLTVSFYYKLQTDLPSEDGWIFLSEENGLPPTDDNPDYTRPYSFHWDTNGHRDPDGKPLTPGACYDISVEVSDLVCNTTDVTDHFKNADSAELCIVDTIAPTARISWLERDLGDWECTNGVEDNWVENPENLHVNRIKEMYAVIDGGSWDTQDVQFFYRAAGSTEWILADADIDLKDFDENDQTWSIYDWSTEPLPEGPYELAAVATDDAGNSDSDPAITTIVIDRTGPEFTAVTPLDDMILMPENVGDYECDPDARVIDLVATTDADDVQYFDSWNNCVVWEWKYTSDADVDENWDSVPYSMTLFDGASGRFSATTDLYELIGSDWASLIDWRVRATDEAGNTTVSNLAWRTVADNQDPRLEITHVSLNGEGDTTIDPIDNGQITDVSAGQNVVIYATASDDEEGLPDSNETDVAEVQFYVRSLGDDDDATASLGTVAADDFSTGEWRFLGTAGYDATLGLWSVMWNTTGLPEGDYELDAWAVDDVGNCTSAHERVVVTVENNALPIASVAGFAPHLKSLVTRGTQDRVYGLTLGEVEAGSVFFQYREMGTEEWSTIGIGDPTDASLSMDERGQWLQPQELWFAEWMTNVIEEGTMLELRAVATDEDGSGLPDETITGGTDSMALKSRLPGQGGLKRADEPSTFSGLYDLANTPILAVNVTRDAFGKTVIEPKEDLGLIEGMYTKFTGRSAGGGRVAVDMSDPTIAPFVVIVGEDGNGTIDEQILEMIPRVDDPTIWQGAIVALEDGNGGDLTDLDPSQGAILTLYATAHRARENDEDPAPRTEMWKHEMRIYEVTVDLGSNGAAGFEGSPNDMFVVDVPPGFLSGFSDGAERMGMLLNATDMPKTPAYQADQYCGIGSMAFEVRLYESDWSSPSGVDSDPSKTATVTLRYNEEDLFFEDGTPIDESTLSARQFDGGADEPADGWEYESISKVVVDTLNNTVTFETDDLNEEVFAVVALKQPQFTFETSPSWNGATDQDPILRGQINLGSEELLEGDEDDINASLYIDGKLVANTDNGYIFYPGSSFFITEIFDQDQFSGIWDYEYRHTCGNNDAMKDGWHTASIRVYVDGEQLTPITSQEFDFYVDATAPYIEFHSGFIGNPRLGFAAGYVNLNEDIVTVRMSDSGSGLLFREDRIDDYVSNDGDLCEGLRIGILCELIRESFPEIDLVCFGPTQGDGSFKYDVWVVDDCDGGCDGGPDQSDIDEVEERTLIYTGTADAVAPYTTPALSEYTPADTLEVPLAVLTGGNLIKDGSVVEITLYSHKIAFAGGSLGGSVNVDDLAALLAGQGLSLTFNAKNEEYVAYVRGPMDCVFNAGSRFVEQRFIVDSSAPTVTPAVPGIVCDGETEVEPVPQAETFLYVASFDDPAGVDPNSVQIRVVWPDGNVQTNEDLDELNISENGVSFVISSSGGLLPVGTYSVTISGTDMLSNAFTSTCRFIMGSGTTLAIRGDKVVPNPFSPLLGNATIMFELSKRADVEIKAYDFNGQFVATIFQGTKNPGQVAVEWSGQTEDGRALGNGVYLIRINVNDGVRQEPRVLKAAIWNER